MRLVSHLNVQQNPFYIPDSFMSTFPIETISLDFDPFSTYLPNKSMSIFGLKTGIAYSLNEPLPKTFTVKSYHSNVIVKASDSCPQADAQYVAASNPKLSQILQGKKHLGLQTADCLAVSFVFEEKEHYLGALSHAGWRGFTSGILQNTLEVLKQEALAVGISSEHLLSGLKVHISPAIFGVSYEAGEDTQKALQKHGEILFLKYPKMNYYSECYQSLIDIYQDAKLSSVVENHLLQNQQSCYLPHKIFPDLQLLAAVEFVASGVLHENIEILRENTYNHPTLFSFREATHKKTNRSLRQWTHLCFPSTED
ncbi:laccase domain-containing protein [Silvanigrella aquatica]|uniref:Laccase domain-containing protein n=1 Tax=Silvanigrella aquatica TaxID=1915309 RepID=A0A1L4CY45_9BACT|nr:laccase domain-containing protein [Silvanigrella aquatica]APJ02866.1 hypothetical protein AXG55_02590 [Silvanigrella aquatica]